MQVGMHHLINGRRMISETDVGTSICLLARDGHAMPSASSTVTVVESRLFPGEQRMHRAATNKTGATPLEAQ